MFVTIQRENTRPSKKEINKAVRMLKLPNIYSYIMNHYVFLSLTNRKSSVHLLALYTPRTALRTVTPCRDQLVICGQYVDPTARWSKLHTVFSNWYVETSQNSMCRVRFYKLNDGPQCVAIAVRACSARFSHLVLWAAVSLSDWCYQDIFFHLLHTALFQNS
jgi:hypothetical protein